ncbi:MAG: LytTR family DNA-binding domain-containing protein [Pseudomonadota bacterium]
MAASERIRTLIADDEAVARLGLRKRLESLAPATHIVGEAENGTQTVQLVQRLNPDLVFLDIAMPGLTGLEVAKRIGTHRQGPLIVFLTAYGDRAVEAFETEAIDYLMKPVSAQRLARALERAHEELQRRREVAMAAELKSVVQRFDAPATPPANGNATPTAEQEVIRLDTGDGFVRQPEAAISHLETAGDYVCVHTDQGTLIVRSSLKHLEEQLVSRRRFFRVNRQTVVNVDHVLRITSSAQASGSIAELREGQQIPISRRQLAALRALLGSR